MDIGNIPPMISNCAVKTDDHVPAKNVVRGTEGVREYPGN